MVKAEKGKRKERKRMRIISTTKKKGRNQRKTNQKKKTFTRQELIKSKVLLAT